MSVTIAITVSKLTNVSYYHRMYSQFSPRRVTG